jgi:membrane-associated phospholipid phosphatase/tRNA A-37 threonylcarbamoyl transferase component Bud32
MTVSGPPRPVTDDGHDHGDHDEPRATLPLPETVRQHRRRRRPTGAPPPLPRTLGTSGKAWLVVNVLLLLWVPIALMSPAVLRVADVADTWFLRLVANLRTPWLTRIVSETDRIATGWAITITALGLIVAIVAFRRWRHLFTFLGAILVLELLGELIYDGFSRPRPYGITAIGRWSGFSMPSAPVAFLAAILLAIPYTLLPHGRPRDIGKWVIAFVIGGVVGCRLYLGVDHPSDVIVGVALGIGIPLLAFRWFTPTEVFPVAYKTGKTAHLDVGGERGDAIRAAVQDQLGLTVLDAKPVGLAGSGGSTPLRLTVSGEPNMYLFAKLYAMNHVRADRWYKLGRTILYGRLEDEAPFSSVRRLVQYEDHMLRLLRDVGIPTAMPYGIVEITPEREYMLVTEFFDGAVELGDAEVDDGIIDNGLLLIRRLWDAGIAHRDIKPANLMVRDGHVLLIDVFFVQVRPSPWREAVDLANMMLVLAVRTDAERVYRRALEYFTPDDIAEAFAAAHGVASPTQLRAVMKQDGRDLVGEFRALAPPRQPIALQRWNLRRFVLSLGLLAAVVIGFNLLVSMFQPVHSIPVDETPQCDTGDVTVLVAQSVPSATKVPCVASMPAGWSLERVNIRRNRTRYWFDSDQAGESALEVTLQRRSVCDVSRATRVPSDEVGMQRYEQPGRLPPGFKSRRYYLFQGGCVTYDFDFDLEAPASLSLVADGAIDFQPRETLVAAVEERSGQRLCGAGAPCPGGHAPGETDEETGA